MQFSGTCKECGKTIVSGLSKAGWVSAVKEHSLTCRPKPKVEVGQRFQECDKRIYRIVEVVRVSHGQAYIKTVANDAGILVKDAYNRETRAKLERFYRYSNGYRRLYGACHECQLAAGAVVPKWGHQGITVSIGTCSKCLKRDATLVPDSDYHWPKQGRKATWD